jgi:hypothetical protein
MLRISGYAWEKGSAKQVAYRAADGHIHELVVSVGGPWSHADLTQATGAPQPAPDTAPSGFEWTAGGTKQVVYVTADGHLHELSVSVGGSWSDADLTQAVAAPLVFDQVSFSGYEWKTGGTKQVVYPAAGGHIHELVVSVGGRWSHADLTQATGAPREDNAVPVIAGFEWESGGTKQVVYRPADRHVHELFVSVGGSWDHADLTQTTGAPLPDFASVYACFGWKAGATKQIVYLTEDGHIHELSVPVGGSWSHVDLTQTTGAPPLQPDTAFTGYEWKAGDSKQVVYRTEDGHIHELFLSVGGSWSHADLTQVTGAPPASTNTRTISGYEWVAGGTKQVVFVTANGHIHELVIAVGDSWSHADLTQITGAPPVA